MDRRKQGRGGNRGGPLNIVIKCAESIAITVQNPKCVLPGEVFPLQQNLRPPALNGRDKCLNKVVVLRPANAMMLPANVDGIVSSASLSVPTSSRIGRQCCGGIPPSAV